MKSLRKSTAVAYFVFGPFVDSTDGVTPKTALTILNTDFKIQKYGTNTFVSKSDTSSGTHIAKGYYWTALNTTDTNTIGDGMVDVQISGACPVFMDICVYSQRKYDMDYGDGSQVSDFDAIGGRDNKQLAQAVPAANKITLVSGTQTSEGCFILINTASSGAGQLRQVLDIDRSDPAAYVATVDADWDPALTAGAVTYSSYMGPGTPAIPPEANAVEIGGVTQTGNDLDDVATDAAAAAASAAAVQSSLAGTLTESYPALGAEGSIAQLLYLILSVISQKSITTDTLTALKLDGTTPAATYHLNDKTSPTKVTRTG